MKSRDGVNEKRGIIPIIVHSGQLQSFDASRSGRSVGRRKWKPRGHVWCQNGEERVLMGIELKLCFPLTRLHHGSWIFSFSTRYRPSFAV